MNFVEVLRFYVQILSHFGEFIVEESGVLAASGIVRKIGIKEEIGSIDELVCKSDMTKDDIYEELELRGGQMGDRFRSIRDTSFTGS